MTIRGKTSKSPKAKHAIKREAEKNIKKNRSKIENPKKSIKDVFNI